MSTTLVICADLTGSRQSINTLWIEKLYRVLFENIRMLSLEIPPYVAQHIDDEALWPAAIEQAQTSI